MFHFAMDRKDASYNPRALMRVGVFEDLEFKEALHLKFRTEHPDWDEDDTEASFEYIDMQSEVYFTAKDFVPKSRLEAMEFVATLFFFAPMRLWLNGAEVSPWREDHDAAMTDDGI